MGLHSLCGLAEVTFINDSIEWHGWDGSDFTDYAPRRGLKGTKSGINSLAFACHVVVNQKLDCFTVRSA